MNVPSAAWTANPPSAWTVAKRDRIEVATGAGEDEIKRDVRDTVRTLNRAEVSLAIDGKRVRLATERLEVARIDLERGATSSRDVVEAQTGLQDAQNALVQAKVDYLIATITLRKRIGTLRVDERGMWR